MMNGVSVLVPIFNGEPWIKSSFENLKKVVDEADLQVEVLFIYDTGSKDRTIPLLQEVTRNDSRFKMVQSPLPSLVGSLNHGIQLAQYDWLMRHDVDDIAHPSRIRVFHERLRSLDSKTSEEIVLVTSSALFADKDDRLVGIQRIFDGVKDASWLIQPTNPLVHGSVFMKKAAIQKLGGYTRNIAHAEDFDLWMRIGQDLKNSKILGIKEPLYWNRTHATSVSSDIIAKQISAVERYLDSGQKGIWTALDRGAVRRLIWEGRFSSAVDWMFKHARLRRPLAKDLLQIARIISFGSFDHFFGWCLRKMNSNVDQFCQYVFKLKSPSSEV